MVGDHNLHYLGFFYNGRHFISFDGEKTTLHPNIEVYIASYLTEKNASIAPIAQDSDMYEPKAAKRFLPKTPVQSSTHKPTRPRAANP